jgi:protein-disulfide isomerase
MFLAGCVAGVMALAPAALAAEFNDAQKSEIESLIREYLLNNPEVIREAIQELDRRDSEAEAKAQQSAIQEHASAIYHEPHDLVGGNPEGNVTVVEFFDYNCGYCKRALKDVTAMIEKDKDLRVVMKEFPILGPGSLYAAQAALASRNQGKYWDFHLAMLGHEGRVDEKVVDKIAQELGLDVERLKKDMQHPSIVEALQKNMNLAESLKINGTPAFIIDRTLIPGAVGYDSLAAAVDKVRKEGGCQIC